MAQSRKLAALLAADVVGFSRLTSADEDRTLARLRALRSDLVDPTISVHNGRVIKRTGDGVLVEFRSVVDAVGCAIEMQNGMIERNVGVPPERCIEFRIGIHLGDVVEESDGDLMGDGVNIAARLESIAKPGAICLSEDAYRQVKGRLDLQVSDLGATQLKNIAEPMRVYSLQAGLPAQAKLTTPVNARSEEKRPRYFTLPDQPSIAVLPFANMSSDIEQEYFADGISEDIITALSKLSQLFVIARNSSFTFKGKNVLMADVGKSLGVHYVLAGSVRKSGSRVRINAQLIDATTGGHLWAERFDRDLTDIFAVQDEVTTQIVSALALNLSTSDRQSIAAEHTDNLEAYDCFLRGRELWWLHAREANREAETLLKRATEFDPSFAPALAFLAAAKVHDYVNEWSPAPAQALEEAEEAARRAVQLDGRYPYALWALSMSCLFARHYDEAVNAAEESISFNPNFAEGHLMLGNILHYVGRSEEALKCFERAVARDPRCPGVWLHFQAQAAYQLGRYPEAVGLLKRRILDNPDTDASRMLLAASYGQMGLVGEAREAWRDALRVNPDYSLEHRRRVLPYKNLDDFERVTEGLRKAGLPEQ
jgi:TolB-like protein/class 3 adenylate cyclase/Tfp pilus assembly protein PilF